MRRSNPFLNALALAVGGLLAPPALAQTEFRGGGFVADFSAPCAAEGWAGASQIVARHRPAGAPGNAGQTHLLSLFFDSYTLHFAFTAAPAGQWVTAQTAAAVGATHALQTDPAPRIRLLPPPAGTVQGPDEVHLLVEIDHFSFLPNCRARANLLMSRR